MVKYQWIVGFGQKQTASSSLFIRDLKTTSARCGVIATTPLVTYTSTLPARILFCRLASLLELQEAASLGCETSGLGQKNLLGFWIKEVNSFLIRVELNAIAHAVIAVGAHPRNE